jgi:hypothetical protein
MINRLILGCILAHARALALSVTLAWNPNPEQDVAGYRVYYGTPAGNFGSILDVGKVTGASIQGLDSSKSYGFRLTCYNSAGLESDPSRAVFYNPTGLVTESADIQILWESPAPVVYGTRLSTRELNARALHAGTNVLGLFVYSPPLGTTLPAKSNHVLSVQFIPANTNAYNRANQSVNLEVERALLTIKASDRHKTYGRNLPSFVFTYSGFVNGDSAYRLEKRPSATTEANSESPVGNYLIYPYGAKSTNYVVVYEAGTLIVDPAELDIYAPNITRYAWTDNPPLKIRYYGFVLGHSESMLSPSPSLTTSAQRKSAPGTYPITISQTYLPNYKIVYHEGRVRINPLTKPIVTLEPQILNLRPGESGSFTLSLIQTNGFRSPIDSSSVTWYSLSRHIALIDSMGKASTLRLGRARVGGKYMGLRAYGEVVASENNNVSGASELALLLDNDLGTEVRIVGDEGDSFDLESTSDLVNWDFILSDSIDVSGEFVYPIAETNSRALMFRARKTN